MKSALFNRAEVLQLEQLQQNTQPYLGSVAAPCEWCKPIDSGHFSLHQENKTLPDHSAEGDHCCLGNLTFG